MTIRTRDGGVITAHLSWRDWVYIIVSIITVISLFFTAYLRHDRMLSDIAAGQRLTEHRLTVIERKMP